MRDDSALSIFAATLAADGCDLDATPASGTRPTTKPATVPGDFYRVWCAAESSDATGFPGRFVALRPHDRTPHWRKTAVAATFFLGGVELSACCALRPDLICKRADALIVNGDDYFYRECERYQFRHFGPTPGAHLLACIKRLPLAPAVTVAPSPPLPVTPSADPAEGLLWSEAFAKNRNAGPTEPGKVYRILSTGTTQWLRLDPGSSRPRWMARLVSCSFFIGGAELNAVLEQRPDLEIMPIDRATWTATPNDYFQDLFARLRAGRGDIHGSDLLANLARLPVLAPPRCAVKTPPKQPES